MAEQMKLSFLATTASKIDELPIVNGQFILIKDTNTIAVDMNDKRTKYEQIITLESDSDRSSILAPVNGVFYFVVETNSLWKYDQGWKMICSAQSLVPAGGSSGQVLTKQSDTNGDVSWQNPSVSDEQVTTAVNLYLEENPVSGMTAEQEQQLNQNTTDVADLKSTINSKAPNAGWNPEKIIGTDAEGNMIDMDVSQLDINNLVFKSEDGKKYSVSIDSDGNFIRKEIIMPVPVTDGLIFDFKAVDGVVKDAVNNEIYSDCSIEGEEITANKTITLKDFGKLSSGTIEIIFDASTKFADHWEKGTLGLNIDGTKQSMLVNNANNINRYLGLYSGNKLLLVDQTVYFFTKSSNLEKISDQANFFQPVSENKMKLTLAYDSQSKLVAVNEYVFNTENNLVSVENDLQLYLGNRRKCYEIRVYDRKLSENEIIRNSICDGVTFSDSFIHEYQRDGITDLGSASALIADSQDMPCKAYANSETTQGLHYRTDGVGYNITDLQEYSNSELSTDFEGVKFANTYKKIKIGEKHEVSAGVYPFNGVTLSEEKNNYFIDYSSSDPEKCECMHGILIPKQKGSVTITAKLRGTEFTDSFTVEIEDEDNENVEEEETCYIKSDYAFGINPLNGGSAKQTALCIFHAIKEASALGFKKIVFPYNKYYVYPVFDEGDNESICCIIPSDIIIDFSGSELYIQDNPYIYKTSDTVRYKMFVFANGAKNSKLINLNIFGERLNNTTHAESEYSDSINVISFQDCENCLIKNVKLDSCVGFQVIFECIDQYDYFGGIRDEDYTAGSGKNNRGRLVYQDFASGDLDDSGELIENPLYICTPEKHAIGYDPEKLKYFRIGNMGTSYYSRISSRWIKTYWYNEEGVLLNEGGTLYRQFDRYELPEGAKFFKISAFQSEVPTKNAGEDECVIRLYPFLQSFMSKIEDCKFENNHSWALTFVGGDSTYIKNCYVETGPRYGYWSIDMEDGFETMRHNVFDNIVSKDSIQCYAGLGNSVISSCFAGGYKSIYFKADCSNSKIINNWAKAVDISDKECGIFAANHYTSITENAGHGEVRSWQNTKEDRWPF